jgi:hypothetical protein
MALYLYTGCLLKVFFPEPETAATRRARSSTASSKSSAVATASLLQISRSG